MIPRLKPDLRLSDLIALVPSGDSAEDIGRFERGFAELAGQKHAIAFPYGRTAQIAMLKALGRPGSEVICPSYTCVVVPHAIVKAGMRPVFVDSDPADYNMDWTFAHDATGPETAAVIATSIFGHPVNGDGFRAYRAANPDVIVFQDCAHSFFAGDAHRDGLAAFFGLNVSKIITAIFGGMVTTDDDAFAVKVRSARSSLLSHAGIAQSLRRSLYLAAVIPAFWRPVYGIVNRLERWGALDRFVKYYDPSVIDLPADAFKTMTSIEARTGARQLSRYERIVAHRRRLADLYHHELTGVGDLLMPPKHDAMTVSHFVIRTDHAEYLKSACRTAGVQLGELIDYDCAKMPSYRDAKYIGERRSSAFPAQVINLPVHMGVTLDDAWRICGVIAAEFGASAS